MQKTNRLPKMLCFDPTLVQNLNITVSSKIQTGDANLQAILYVVGDSVGFVSDKYKISVSFPSLEHGGRYQLTRCAGSYSRYKHVKRSWDDVVCCWDLCVCVCVHVCVHVCCCVSLKTLSLLCCCVVFVLCSSCAQKCFSEPTQAVQHSCRMSELSAITL